MGVPYMMAEQSDHNLARKQSPDVTNKHSLLHRHPERAARQMTVAQTAFLTHALPVLSLGVPAGMQPFLPIIGQGQGPRLPLPARGDCHSLLLMNGAAHHSAIGGRLGVPVLRLHGWYLDGQDVSGRVLIGRQSEQLGWSRAEALQALTRV